MSSYQAGRGRLIDAPLAACTQRGLSLPAVPCKEQILLPFWQ